MRERQSALFRGRHFRSEVIILCVRWYLRYHLSYWDLEEMMTERGLSVDHSSIARWVLFLCADAEPAHPSGDAPAQPLQAGG